MTRNTSLALTPKFLAVMLALATFALVDATATPSSAEVCLHMDPNFRGQRVCINREVSRARMNARNDDRVSSLEVGEGWGIKVCEERDFGGWCRYFATDIRRLRDSNNAISSYEVFRILDRDPAPPPPPAPPPSQGDGVVCLYENHNYGGDTICVNGETRVARLQPWDDNRVSSFRVSSGWKLRACRDPNFGGWCREFTADEPVLRASNDAISSFEVTRVVVAEPPRIRVACLFSEPSFNGIAVCSEEAERINNMGPRLNDNVSSIRLAPGWSMVVCMRPNMQGRCARLDENAAGLGGGFDNGISSYQVFQTNTAPSQPQQPQQPQQPPPQPGIVSPGQDGGAIINIPGIIGAIAGEVCFFEHTNFQGRKICGRAGTNRTSLSGWANDSISSIRVPPGLRAIACVNAGMGGECRTYETDVPFVGPRFNDRVSSFRVTPNF